jgi:hypothetical protein
MRCTPEQHSRHYYKWTGQVVAAPQDPTTATVMVTVTVTTTVSARASFSASAPAIATYQLQERQVLLLNMFSESWVRVRVIRSQLAQP